MAETPILTKHFNFYEYWDSHEAWVCERFIKEMYSSTPYRISLSFSTKKSTDAVCILVWENDWEILWEFSKEESCEASELKGICDMVEALDEFLNKHYKITKTKKKLYVTIYDRTEA